MGALDIASLPPGLQPGAEAAPPRGPLGVLEVLDRDGQLRQSVAIAAWPLRIGRALDNDIVLADPHVAPHHLSVSSGDDGLAMVVGDTRNGVHWGRHHLLAGERRPVPAEGEPVELTAGRSRLRLRLPGHALAPEVPLAAMVGRGLRFWPLAAGASVLLAALLFNTYLASDPDALGRATGSMLVNALVVAAGWCGAWALLSKTFTRQSHFGWHLRVFVFAGIGLMLADVAPGLVAFMFSWPAASDFGFMLTYAIGAAALYFHLLAVEPARPRLMRWVAITGAVVGVALTLWFNLQRSGLFGQELYMSHLFPPSWRLARPVPADDFIKGLAPLQPLLERKAREPAQGDDGDTADDSD